MLAIPAFLTAELTAFTAVCMLFKSWLRSPVAVGTFRCSASTNLVRVIQSESKEDFSVVMFTKNDVRLYNKVLTIELSKSVLALHYIKLLDTMYLI